MKEKELKVIEVPSDGKRGVAFGGWGLHFMYTKHHGNFILKGYHREVMEYIREKGITHWICNVVLYKHGKVRYNEWEFWKKRVYINKRVRARGKACGFYMRKLNESYERIKTIEFRRIPHRWIPEFDSF